MFTEILTALHIVGGCLALAASFIAIMSRIIRSPHRIHVVSGRVFFFAMVTVCLTAIAISAITVNEFLLLVATFSGYMVLAGWSYARNRAGAPSPADWVRVIVMSVCAITMAAFGIESIVRTGDSNGITMLAFAGIGGALVAGDVRIYRAGGVKGTDRIRRHMTLMLGATIAAITAFVVVNFSYEPGFVLWLAPSITIIPMIVFWNRKLKADSIPNT